MKGFIRFMLVGAMIASVSCSSQPVEDDMSLEGDAAIVADDGSDVLPDENQDFSDFDEPAAKDEQAATEQAVAQDELSIEEELSESGGEPLQEQQAQNTLEDELSLDEPAAEPQQPAVVDVPPAETSPEEDPFATPEPAPVAIEPEATPVPVPELEPTPAPAPETPPTLAQARITNLKFKANDAGGTVIVEADQPLTYTTRMNPDLGQYIIEVENATLPESLKRSLNTRDIKGSFGAIDAYQNPGSSTARFVIQLRQGVEEPVVQAEGTSLLIMASLNEAKTAEITHMAEGTAGAVEDTSGAATLEGNDQNILTSQNLAEFLSGNTNFYGKKISIETNNMDIRDALAFITEESGVNMVVSDEVKGAVSLKLRQVPWDQALVVIMRAKKLGYTRQGNVLRIAPLSDLKAEEEDATRLAASRKTMEPLKVRMFPVSYAKVEDLEKRLKDFLGERGKVIGDTRTNSLVVTDIDENLERIAKLIASLDTQPPQVLIEGKIVEAKETFTRRVGVNWQTSGMPIRLSNGSRGPVNLTPRLTADNGSQLNSNMVLGINLGTLDILGNLTASLALAEMDETVKVISSPRVVTLTNEKAEITQTTEVPLIQVTINQGVQTESIQFKPLNLKLEVTPQVTADGSVMMKVLVNRQFQGATISTAQGAFSVNTREANTKVLVKNGQTAVIGGIYQSDAQNTDTGTPLLKDIPVLGYLFKANNSKKDKSELLIFLTPRILGQLEGAEKPAPEL